MNYKSVLKLSREILEEEVKLGCSLYELGYHQARQDLATFFLEKEEERKEANSKKLQILELPKDVDSSIGLSKCCEEQPTVKGLYFPTGEVKSVNIECRKCGKRSILDAEDYIQTWNWTRDRSAYQTLSIKDFSFINLTIYGISRRKIKGITTLSLVKIISCEKSDRDYRKINSCEIILLGLSPKMLRLQDLDMECNDYNPRLRSLYLNLGHYSPAFISKFFGDLIESKSICYREIV